MRNYEFLPGVARCLNAVIEAIFPAQCAGCGVIRNKSNNPDGFLCAGCSAAVPLYKWVFCPVCNRKLTGIQPCRSHPGPLKAVGAATSYESQLIKTLIWKYKYGFQYTLAHSLSKKLSEYTTQALMPYLDAPSESLLITYIPLHNKRYRWRGFNQAQLLAEYLGKLLNIPVAKALERIAFQTPQMQINEKKHRFENVKNSFGLSRGADIKNKTVLLIDDIAASGATLIEAAKTLKRHGAKSIYGLVIARSQ